jgi:plasmid stability protein
VEVIELDLEPMRAPGLFAFEPPPGATSADDLLPRRPESDVLMVGEQAPRWTGTLLDGGTFSTDDLRGRQRRSPSGVPARAARRSGCNGSQTFVAPNRAGGGRLRALRCLGLVASASAIVDSRGGVVSQLLVRDVAEEIVKALKRRAARHGRSAEAEHREILRDALRADLERASFKNLLLSMPDVGEDDWAAGPIRAPTGAVDPASAG